MAEGLELVSLHFHYYVVDICDIDCRPLLASPSLEDNLLALLCRVDDETEAVRAVLGKIAGLDHNQRTDALERWGYGFSPPSRSTRCSPMSSVARTTHRAPSATASAPGTSHPTGTGGQGITRPAPPTGDPGSDPRCVIAGSPRAITRPRIPVRLRARSAGAPPHLPTGSLPIEVVPPAHARVAAQSEVVAAWRQRMGREVTQPTYKDRAATAKCVNAQPRIGPAAGARTQQGPMRRDAVCPGAQPGAHGRLGGRFIPYADTNALLPGDPGGTGNATAKLTSLRFTQPASVAVPEAALLLANGSAPRAIRLRKIRRG